MESDGWAAGGEEAARQRMGQRLAVAASRCMMLEKVRDHANARATSWGRSILTKAFFLHVIKH